MFDSLKNIILLELNGTVQTVHVIWLKTIRSFSTTEFYIFRRQQQRVSAT